MGKLLQDYIKHREIERESQKRRENFFFLGGFISIFSIIIILYVAIYYVEQHDPTKDLYFYPSTKTEAKSEKGEVYQIENIFPAYDNYNFFLEKKAVNYKTMYGLIGRKFDIHSFRESYEFSIIKNPDNDIANGYGIKRYYIYSLINDKDPVAILYVEKSEGMIIGVTSPYLINAEFKDMTLNGSNFTEVTRLNDFMIGEDKKHYTFTHYGGDLYLATTEGNEYGYKSNDPLIYTATIYSKKSINSILQLIDFYKDNENYVTAYFSIFLNDKYQVIYQTLVKEKG